MALFALHFKIPPAQFLKLTWPQYEELSKVLSEQLEKEAANG